MNIKSNSFNSSDKLILIQLIKHSNQSRLFEKFKKTILNILMKIIEKLFLL